MKFNLKFFLKKKQKEKSKNRVLLDGNEMTNEHLFQLAMMQKLAFPKYYGMNLDAMWDCLSGNDTEYPLEIEWINFEKSKEYLGEDYLKRVINQFEELKTIVEFDYVLK